MPLRTVHRRVCERLAKERSQAHEPIRQDLRCREYAADGERGTWTLTTLPFTSSSIETSQLAYVEASGREVKSEWRLAWSLADARWSPERPGSLEPIGSFDFDGDGRSELVTFFVSGDPARAFNTVQIWTATRTAVTSFGETAQRHLIDIIARPAATRPQFLADPYGLPLRSASALVGPQRLWATLAEITSRGEVELAGPSAQAEALRACPTSEHLLELLADTEGVCVAAYVHCANLWHLPVAATEQALDRFCEQERYDSTPYCPESRETWDRMLHTAPPFTLSTPPTGAP